MGRFESLSRQKTVSLTTYRRNGTPVATPVSVVVTGGRAFFRTYAEAGKAKRLRNNPQVLVAPSTFGGKPTGPSIKANARPLDGDDATLSARLLVRKHPILHGIVVPLGHRVRGYTTVYFELVAID